MSRRLAFFLRQVACWLAVTIGVSEGATATPLWWQRTHLSGDQNQLALIGGGYEALLLRVHLIRTAVRSVDIQTFIWANDECGRLLIYELIEAARRGVKVRIIADHLFSDQDPEIVAFLAAVHPNFEVRHYRPATSRMKPGFLRTMFAAMRKFGDVNQRMHSKVMLVDGAVLVTGGRNIENSYFDHAVGLNFRDRDVLAIGPVVRPAAEQFETFWNYRYTIPSRKLVDVSAALQRGDYRRYERREDFDFGGHFATLHAEASDAAAIENRFAPRLRSVAKAFFLYDPPGKVQRKGSPAAITAELTTAVKSARHTVLLQTPYLVLSPTARDLLRELRRRQPPVDIRISTNSFASTDNVYAYSANYRLRNDYVEGLGLEIFEYKPHPGALLAIFPTYHKMCDVARARGGAEAHAPFLSIHAKSLVVDEVVSFVGSYNLDPRSEHLNTEVGLMVVDRAFAHELRSEIERDMQPENSWTIGRRRLPLRLEAVNGLVDGLLSLTPVDIWPIQNTSSFELLPGHQAVSPHHPAFHERYRDVGSFPGTDGTLSQREIMTRLFKAVGRPLTPIL